MKLYEAKYSYFHVNNIPEAMKKIISNYVVNFQVNASVT
jgi:hypothetical protein